MALVKKHYRKGLPRALVIALVIAIGVLAGVATGRQINAGVGFAVAIALSVWVISIISIIKVWTRKVPPHVAFENPGSANVEKQHGQRWVDIAWYTIALLAALSVLGIVAGVSLLADPSMVKRATGLGMVITSTLFLLAVGVYLLLSRHFNPDDQWQYVSVLGGRYDLWNTPGWKWCLRWLMKAPENWRVTQRELPININPLTVQVESTEVTLQLDGTLKVIDPRRILFSVDGGHQTVLGRLVPKAVQDEVESDVKGKSLEDVEAIRGNDFVTPVQAKRGTDFSRWGVELLTGIVADVQWSSEARQVLARRFALKQFQAAVLEEAMRIGGISNSDPQKEDKVRPHLKEAREAVIRQMVAGTINFDMSKMIGVMNPKDLFAWISGT